MTLQFTPLTDELADAVADGKPGPWAEAPNFAETAATVRSVAVAQADMYRRTGATPPWIGYLAQDPTDKSVVGVCSFTGAPNDGAVEIAYFTFPSVQGRGIGGRMAQVLIDLAFERPEIAAVIAHTRPEENASTRILRRRGFTLWGPVEHAEDGTVWLWRLDRSKRSQ